MAILTGIVEAAALHFDGNDIQRGVVVRAARLRVNIDSPDLRTEPRHIQTDY